MKGPMVKKYDNSCFRISVVVGIEIYVVVFISGFTVNPEY